MARLHISGDTFSVGYSPTYDVERDTLIWAGSHFRVSGGRVAALSMLSPSDLLRGPQARGLLVEGLASMLRRGVVHAQIAVRKPDEIGFCLTPVPDDWDVGEMRTGSASELAEEFADGILICSIMES